MMHNIIQNPRNSFKKKFLLTENSNLMKKKKLEILATNEDLTYNKISTRLNDFPNNYGETEDIINPKWKKLDNINSNKKQSLIVSNFNNFKTATPKRNFIKERNNFSKIKDDNSFYNKTGNFFGLPQKESFRRINTSIINKNRDSSNRTSYGHRFNKNYNLFNTEGNGYISDINIRKSIRKRNFDNYIRTKELINLNNILKEQNRDLRQDLRQMKLKFKEMLKYQNDLENNNRELLYDNNNMLMEMRQLENELDNYKNISLNELETKSNKIKKLNEEIIRMKNMLAIKNDKKINNLAYNNNQYRSQLNYNNNDYYSSEEIKDLDINEENEYENNKYNNNNKLLKKINELFNQINILQNEKKNLMLARQKKEQLLNQKINNLIQERKKYIDIISNLKKELKNSNKNNLNANENETKQLQEKIILLQNENNSLKEKIIIIDKNLKEIIIERNNLIKENRDLKKIQTSLSLKLNTSYNNFVEESKQLISQINEKDKQLDFYKLHLNNPQNNDQISQENNNLKQKIIELQNMNKTLKEANIRLEKENLKISSKMENHASIGAEEKKINSENDEFNNKIIKENNERENQLAKENAKLKEDIQLIKIWQDEGLINTLENLKDELKDKDKQIQKLIEDNKNLRNSISKQNLNYINNFNSNNEDEEEKEIELINNPFRPSMNSQGLNDADKIKLYKERIKEFRQINESDKMQIQELKKDIKNLLIKINYCSTFGGQLKDINEFFYLLNQILISCKPQKKEQKDALEKILSIKNNFHSLNNNNYNFN